MTDEELKALVGENSLAIREAHRELRVSRQQWDKESEKRRRESEKRRRESEVRWQESRRETERLWQEIRDQRQESEKRWQESREEILASRRETDRLIGSLNQQLGRLGNRLGDYAESLIRPSLERALREQFGMTTLHSPMHLQRNGHELEIDVVGYSEDEGKGVYLAEIKSRLRQEGIDQILDDLRQFPRFFPEHRGKKLFGILAALDVPADLRAQVVREGLYLATIKDDVFEIVPPDGFAPRAFGPREV